MAEQYSLPQPFGEDILLNEVPQILELIRRNSPAFNVFNGAVDMNTQLLSSKYVSAGTFKKKQFILIVDMLLPDLSDEIISENQTLLIRAQYYSSGLHHRISFHSRINKKINFKNYPALELTVIFPLRRVSNLFIAIPTPGKPVYLEIPVAGAPPSIRVSEVSLEKMKAYSPKMSKLLPTVKKVDGFKVQFVDLGEVSVNGTISSVDEHHIQIDFDSLSKETAGKLESYLNDEFKARHKPKEDRKSDDDKELQKRLKPIKSRQHILIVLQDETQREKYCSIFNDFKLEYSAYERFNEPSVENYAGARLLVLDAVQGEQSAVELIRGMIDRGEIFPTRFVMIGRKPADARLDAWKGLGIGLYVREDSPLEILQRRLAKWLNIRDVALKTTPAFPNQPVILVVDDSYEIMELLYTKLVKNKYNVISAYDGVEGLQWARKAIPDLILLDLGLPKLEGLDVLASLRRVQLTRNIPVIIITGHRELEKVETAVNLGISGYVTKPFNPEELLKRISTVLYK